MYTVLICMDSMQNNAGISQRRLSDTHWSAWTDTLKPLVKRPKEILCSLKPLKKDYELPGDLDNDVTALITWFLSFEYVVLATFWFKVLQAINDVSCLLQGTLLTLDEEIRLFTSLVSDLQRIRETWSVILEESRIVVVNLGFEILALKRLFNKRDRENRRSFMMKIKEMYLSMLPRKISFELKCFMLLWTRLFKKLKQGHRN